MRKSITLTNARTSVVIHPDFVSIFTATPAFHRMGLQTWVGIVGAMKSYMPRRGSYSVPWMQYTINFVAEVGPQDLMQRRGTVEVYEDTPGQKTRLFSIAIDEVDELAQATAYVVNNQ